MEPATLIGTALSGIVAALLTYFATRRGHEINERTLYLGAVERLTGSLRSEIERLEAERRVLIERITTLEAALSDRERSATSRRAGQAPDA